VVERSADPPKKARNSNVEIRNKFKMQMTNFQNVRTPWAVGDRRIVLGTQYSVHSMPSEGAGRDHAFSAKREPSASHFRTEYTVLCTAEHCVPSTGRRLRATRLLSLLCLTAALLAVAGCTSYEPKIRTGVKAPPMRTQEQIAQDLFKASDDVVAVLQGIKDAPTAKDAIPKLRELYNHVKTLVLEGAMAEKAATPEEKARFEAQFKEKGEQNYKRHFEAGFQLSQRKGLSKATILELVAVMKEGDQNIKMAVQEARNQPAPPPPEILPEKPPDSSCAVVWLLCVIIMAACVGFLYRDGVWSNAIALVNVVLAGLLAMNFYEWLAKFMTNYSDDIHAYVAFFDFLALWICFILFMVVFRAITDVVSRVRVRFLKIVDQVGGIVLSLCIGWIMIGFTLVSLHAAPLAQYPLFGAFQPQNSMFLGMFAPDREWLGFTRYQSKNGYCRAGDKDSFPPDFIEKQLLRRMHIEDYMNGTPERAILVNKKFIKAPANPAPGSNK